MTPPAQLLRGEQVRLTALNESDAATIARWDQDTRFLRFYDARPAHPRTESEIAGRLEELREDDRTFAFGIRPLDSDQLIGTLELDTIIWAHGVCALGIGIGDSDNWGRGYGYEAARLAVAFAFDELNLHRITATVFSYNERSIAMLEKVGFHREGTFREFLQRDGERFDMFLYGLLRPEWRARQPEE